MSSDTSSIVDRQEDGYSRVPASEDEINKDAVLAQPLHGDTAGNVAQNLGTVLPKSILENERQQDIDDDRIRDKGELQMRSIIIGCLIGTLVGAMNVNFGLRTGWTQGGSIFAALVSIVIFSLIKPSQEFTKYECVIAMTTAAAVGTMASTAGLVSSMPALEMLGKRYSIWQMYLWGLSVAYFGVYFASIVRRQLIVHEKLSFPSGTAAAETIKALFESGGDTIQKGRVMFYTGLGSAIYAVVSFFFPFFESPPVPKVIGEWGFRIYVNPLLFGGGMLSGFRSTLSLLSGAVVGWGILGPISRSQGWVRPEVMSFHGPRGWILWVGVAIMTTDSIIQLIFTLRQIYNAIASLVMTVANYFRKDANVVTIDTNNMIDTTIPQQHIPWYWWFPGLCVSAVVLCVVGHFIFDLKVWFALAAIPLSALLSIIAARCAGEIDINPVGGMGKVTQLVYAGLARGQIHTNLLSAAIVAAGAAQCTDMMQDFKCGYLVRVSPRTQFISQCIGIIWGLIVCVPIYKLYDAAYVIGGEDVPAPAAHAWKAVAEVLAKGTAGLPPNVGWGILGGVIFAIILGAASRILNCIGAGYGSYLPSALAFGIGFIIPPKQAMTMFAGAAAHRLWRRFAPDTEAKYFFTVSSGLIAGEGLMGIVIAIMKLVGLRPILTL